MLLDFLLITVFVFVVSFLIMLLAVWVPSAGERSNQHALEDNAEEDQNRGELEELAEMLEDDNELFASRESVEIPHIALPGASLGGGGTNEACSKVAGIFNVELKEEPDEKRKYNRRLRDRRISDQPIEEERRLIQRRVWLRRKEDRGGKTLLSVTDAADTLGVTVEQLYRWLDESDIPFYQVTEGKRRTIKFEIDELLHWYGRAVTRSQNPHTDHMKGI